MIEHSNKNQLKEERGHWFICLFCSQLVAGTSRKQDLEAAGCIVPTVRRKGNEWTLLPSSRSPSWTWLLPMGPTQIKMGFPTSVNIKTVSHRYTHGISLRESISLGVWNLHSVKLTAYTWHHKSPGHEEYWCACSASGPPAYHLPCMWF